MTTHNSKIGILVVDDDEAVCRRLVGILHNDGYDVHQAASAEEAFKIAARQPLDAVLMDIQLPGKSGMEALTHFSKTQPATPIIMVTGHASLEGAVEAIRNQAFDYLIKPVSPSDLKFAIKRATRLRKLENENRSLRELVQSAGADEGVVAKSRSMSDVVSLVRQLAQNESPVLIQGESGTGKDVIARAIHLEGTRSQGPFIAINCAALPESLLESELFGYVRGAFTGADRPRSGLFADADGGTLFLDEIGEMPPSLQSKLLRVLQDGRVRPLGSTEDFASDVRVISATNKDIWKAIYEGDFRSDLYYRLNVIPIELDPLRRRIEDIAPLAQVFASRIDPERQLAASALTALEEYEWPGNVRELSNVIERSLALCSSRTIEASDLRISDSMPQAIDRQIDNSKRTRSFLAESANDGMSLKDVEIAYIKEVLERTNGNKTEAARILGINRTTLYRRNP